MLAASFGPEVVKEKASEDVERLSSVKVAANVVALKVQGVVLLFEDNFPQKDEGPGDGEAVGRLPFLPGATKSIPSAEWCRMYYMGEGGGFPRVRA